MRFTLRLTTLVGLTVAAAGCFDSTAPDPARQIHTAIRGFIVDQNGDGVGGPLVAITIVSAPVNNVSKLLSSAQLLPDDQGRFVVTFSVNDEVPQTGYARLTVTAPPGTGLAGRDTLGIPVQFERGFPPIDTTVVTVTLPPR